MAKLDSLKEKVKDYRQEISDSVDKTGTPYQKFKSVVAVIVKICYHLRKVILAAPVVYYALKIAAYNMEHLPELVGINLQSNGAFADTISRSLAVMGPLGLTGACLILMFCSKKALYAWSISVFTLALPIVLLLSNQYPA